MKIKFVVGLLLAVSRPAFALESEQDAWQGSSLKYGQIASELSIGKCFHDAVSLVICLNVADSLGAKFKRPVSFDLTGTFDKKLGCFMSRPVPEKTFEERLTDLKNTHTRIEEQYKKALNAIKKSPRPCMAMTLQSLVTTIVGDIPHETLEAYVTAQAINAGFAVLDPHTQLVSEDQIDKLRNGSEAYYGIGVELDSVGGFIHLKQVFDGGTAFAAHLMPGDFVLEVNDKPVAGLSPLATAYLIRGEAESEVHLKIRHDEETSIRSMKRAFMQITSVRSRPIVQNGKKIMYVRIGSFDDFAGNGLVEALADPGLQGAILDLRGNPGGLLDVAGQMLGAMIEKGRALYGVQTLYGNWIRTFGASLYNLDLGGLIQQAKALFVEGGITFAKNDPLFKKPVVILIDGESASASEIIAAGIQDNERGWIVGETSFGKGTVQQSSMFASDHSGETQILRTIQRFLRPNGKINNMVGVTPDFSVYPTPEQTAPRTNRLSERDLVTRISPVFDHESDIWKSPRPAALADIQACVNANETPEQTYRRQKASEGYADYQLIYALKVLACSAEKGVADSSL